jgi:hypothetical protein
LRRVLRDRLRELRRQGFQIGSVSINGHAKVRVTTPSGAPTTIIVSESPSDHRVQRKFAAQLRRLARTESKGRDA